MKERQRETTKGRDIPRQQIFIHINTERIQRERVISLRSQFGVKYRT